jgi:hypothetical protein
MQQNKLDHCCQPVYFMQELSWIHIVGLYAVVSICLNCQHVIRIDQELKLL